ncbi:putative nitroreductase [Indibacter alkaliphilus LW1]|uniref:Nitroreductase n=1 Tax=Indibacter alkaliphilus (strain CCUG 57479 / KCTC 22604 / LW1) TaxID=1189612 RepID=S2DMD4_INDAL|nr:nitroreductase family protein [Indibacter alkaliphilus]EPA00285.1 putative nitroreductase [Indibacter alkaliphilus LW1]
MKDLIQEREFSDIVEERRSVRVFDQRENFNHQVIQECLELATLAPNSSNLQLWEFYRVPESSKLKKALAEICMRQSAARTARELVVIVARRDNWKERARANYEQVKKNYNGINPKKEKQVLSYYGKLIPRLYSKYPFWSLTKRLIAWLVGLKRPMVREVSETDVRISVHKSVALAAMTFMYAMKSKGYDTCPLEGFDSKRVKKLLDLPKSAEISMVIACGKGLPEGIYGERFRVPSEEVIFEK